MPINPGHLLIIPKNHMEGIFQLPDALFGEIFQVAKKLSEPLRQATSAKRIGLAIEGLGVPHAHIHLVPIHNGNELNPERAREASESELKKMQESLVEAFRICNCVVFI